MKKFLVPTDFSDYARDALIYAVELCKSLGGGEIIFMNVYPVTSISPYVYDQLIDSVRKEIQDKTLHRLEDEWHKHAKKILKGKEVTVKYIGKEGTIVDNIVTTADKEKADMIIMGTKGAGKIKRLLFGSNASKVIANAKCPVLTIPKLAKYKSIKRILYVTECNKHEINNISTLNETGKVYDSEIHIAYIPDEKKETALKKLDKFKHEVTKKENSGKLKFELIESNDTEDAVNVYIQLKNISLLSLTTKRRSLFKKIFNKELARELSFHLKVPLLAFKK
jgi:nucleotide-binding universal stress UspA family protein